MRSIVRGGTRPRRPLIRFWRSHHEEQATSSEGNPSRAAYGSSCARPPLPGIDWISSRLPNTTARPSRKANGRVIARRRERSTPGRLVGPGLAEGHLEDAREPLIAAQDGDLRVGLE